MTNTVLHFLNVFVFLAMLAVDRLRPSELLTLYSRFSASEEGAAVRLETGLGPYRRSCMLFPFERDSHLKNANRSRREELDITFDNICKSLEVCLERRRRQKMRCLDMLNQQPITNHSDCVFHSMIFLIQIPFS